MGNAWSDLHVLQGSSARSAFGPTSTEALSEGNCSVCGATQMAMIAWSDYTGHRWMRCVSCFRGHVVNDGVVSPASAPLETPLGLDGRVLEVWAEIRACLGVGAYAAAVMLCRNLLLHVAVENGLANPVNASFVDAVNHLTSVGVVTSKMKPWVDRIRTIGNAANHELEPITEHDAQQVSEFTLQLLKLAYEMDFRMRAAGETAT